MASASPKSKFDAAVKVIHSLPKDGPFQPSREMMLLFYGYFKQATEGPCRSPKPSFWDVVKKAKWEAWSKLGNMEKETAMLNYVDELKKTLKDCTKQWNEMSKNGDPRIVETMPQTNEVGDFMEVLGSFYEIVDEDAPMKTVANGVPLDDGYNTEPSTDTSTDHGDTLENGVENEDTSAQHQVETLVKQESSNMLSSDSEDEFCDTSADLQMLEVQNHKLDVEKNGAVTQEQIDVTLKPVKSNRVRFSDSERLDKVDGGVRETVHVAQGFPFISSDNVNGQGDVMLEASSPINTALSVRKLNGELNMGVSASNISANNSNIVGVVDEGDEPPDRGDGANRGKDKSQKAGQSNRQSGSRGGLQSSGGRRVLLPGGGSGGGAGGGEQGSTQTSEAVNEQIASILVRLQQDMTNVLDRLNRLETQSRQKKGGASEENSSWWPFAGRAGRAAFFFFVWPIVVHLALSFFFRRRRKR